MAKIKFLIALATVILSFSLSSFAQTATCASTANIVAPIVVEKNADLRFGNIVASATAGTVSISVVDVRTKDGGAAFPSIVGEYGAAQFTVVGFAGSTYNITIPTATTLTNETQDTSTGNTMEVDSFTKTATAGTLTNGTDTFKVGATINVNANQAVGTYTGTFSVTVNYS